MDVISNLGLGFAVALTIQNIAYCFIGVLLGTIIGVLPGIGPVTTVAMLLPISLAASPLAAIALQFGPAEYFSLMVCGLVAAVVLAHGSLVKAIAMVVLGLLLGLVGTDVNTGARRFNFGMMGLADGIEFVAI